MNRDGKDIFDWAEANKKEIYKIADALSHKRTNKPLSEHELQVQLKVVKSAERIFYE